MRPKCVHSWPQNGCWNPEGSTRVINYRNGREGNIEGAHSSVIRVERVGVEPGRTNTDRVTTLMEEQQDGAHSWIVSGYTGMLSQMDGHTDAWTEMGE